MKLRDLSHRVHTNEYSCCWLLTANCNCIKCCITEIYVIIATPARVWWLASVTRIMLRACVSDSHGNLCTGVLAESITMWIYARNPEFMATHICGTLGALTFTLICAIAVIAISVCAVGILSSTFANSSYPKLSPIWGCSTVVCSVGADRGASLSTVVVGCCRCPSILCR